MIFQTLQNLIFGSLRRQLIIGVAVFLTLFLALFIWHLTSRQQDLLRDQQVRHATALARSVATSSAGWMLARDVIGLQEILQAQLSYPELRFAMALDRQGAVLAHTDRRYLGRYVTDLPRNGELTVLAQSSMLVDVASPVMVAGNHVGWIRIGIGQQATATQLAEMRREGIVYALTAILIGALLAGLVGIRLTRRLHAIQSVADSVRAGESGRRVEVTGSDEAANLARQFNGMLDTLAQREEEAQVSRNALRESEMRFRQLFEQVPTVAVQGYTPDGSVRYWNKSSENLYGYSEAEAVGGNLLDLIIPPPMREEVRQAVARMAQNGQALPAEELRLMRKDGSLVSVYSSHVVLDTADSGRELYCLDVDMTESKAQEALLRQDREQQRVLREMLEDVVKGGALKETLEACLARLLKVSWLALLPKGGVFLMGEDGQTLRLTVSNNLSPEIQSLCDQVPVGRCHCGRAAASREMQFSHCLDHHHDITYPGMAEHGHYNLPLLSEGDVLGVMVLYLPHGFERDALKEQFLSSVADVLAGFIRRKNAEEALRRLNEDLEGRVQLRTVELLAAKVEAERASRAKSEFLSRMSHELRTPLNAILGFGQLLELGIQEEEQADNVREILHAGRHLLDLINEVLDLARIEAGRLSLSQEPVPLMPLVEECLALIRPQAEARAIHVVEAGRDCGQHVRADRVRLKQVLLNLLSNAVKYNREGGSLGIVCVHEADTIQVRISDTGAGLTPEQRARLFVAFERLDADKQAIEGTGIGLALSKRLVELMEGEIGVESTPGVGSSFWVRLATADGHRESDHPAAVESDEPVARAGATTRRDVLCIEDNPANLRLIERILSRRDDIRLLTAGTPGLGLELAAAHQPSLILLDINLPDMDGYEVMKCLRENPATRDIPVVAVSANAMPGDLARGKAAGFADYLTKPLDVDQLLGVVDTVIAPRDERIARAEVLAGHALRDGTEPES